jgi:ribosomal protein S18 acetylase RimI-like enzyme
VTEVREAHAAEHDAVGRLTAEVYVTGGWASDDYVPALRAAASRAETATVLVAVDGDDVLGAVTVVTRGGPWTNMAVAGEAEIRMLAVDPAGRGQGVGEALTRACVDRARADGCALVRLSSEPDMHAAHRLYGRLGFVRTPSLDWSPVPGVDLLAFGLPLLPWCDQCGRELTPEGHERCRAAAALEPPRYCGHCRRRMVVQVTPTGWTARCVEHGTRAS